MSLFKTSCRTYSGLLTLAFGLFAIGCTNVNPVAVFTKQSSSSSNPSLSVSDQTVNEYGVASVKVSLSSEATKDVNFNYYTQDGTAVSSLAFLGITNSSATIPKGQTSIDLPVSIYSNYDKSSTAQSFLFGIKDVVNASLNKSSSLISIQDDDFTKMSGVVQVARGSNFACLLTTSGGVKCWGNNTSGQLGNGSASTQSNTPVDVTGLTSGVSAVSAGGAHACALTTAGGLKCWGSNGNGQIGDGFTADRSTPVDVSGHTSGIASVSAGTNHTCAVTTASGARCWGNNSNGQIGDGTTTQRLTSIDVSSLTSEVAAISAGGSHTCALTTTGGAKCWGNNTNGRLGDGTTTQRTTAVDVTGLTGGVSAISAGGSNTCALITSTSGVKCWGNNTNGQIGDGTTTQRTTAVDVTGLTSGVSSISAGQAHTCALTTSGGAKCWGSNSDGQIGDGTTTQRNTAVDVTGLTSGVSSISVGGLNSCAVLTATQNLMCWGSNLVGQIGDNLPQYRNTPTDVDLLKNSQISGIGMFNQHTCALSTSGGVKCWGSNGDGRLGDGTTTQRSTPVDVTGLTSGVAAVSAGGLHTCALTTSGGVKCWGYNFNGQIGDGTSTARTTAVDVTGLTSGVSAVSTGQSHSCALTTAGGVKCWGYNLYGQLGDGSTTDRLTAVDVTGLTSGAAAVSSGYFHTCALTTSGGAKCWGQNTNGQIGDGTTTQRSTAVDVTGLTSGVSSIVAGPSAHTCAVTSTGGVKCWGQNTNGQLGDGSVTQRNTAVDATGLTSGIKSIALGIGHSCALSQSGAVLCWGENSQGELCDGTTVSKSVATAVPSLSVGVKSISAGGDNTCATLSQGVKCWGTYLNSYEIGDNYNNYTPKFVVAP
jgi:alpha-tubulin suppressor-like RCC1 family protein